MNNSRNQMQGSGTNGSTNRRGFRRRDMQGNLTDDGTGFNPTAAYGGKSGGLERWHEMNPQAGGGPSWRADLPSALGLKITGWKKSSPPIPIYGPIDPDPHFDQTGKGPAAVEMPSSGASTGTGASQPKPAGGAQPQGSPSDAADRMRPNALGGGLSRWYALNPNPAPKGAYANVGLRKPAKPKATPKTAASKDWEYPL